MDLRQVRGRTGQGANMINYTESTYEMLNEGIKMSHKKEASEHPIQNDVPTERTNVAGQERWLRG